jgi:hypothetical protein
MRVFLSILFLVCSLTAGYSKSPRADRIADVKAGLMSLGNDKTIKDETISTGTRIIAAATITKAGKNIEIPDKSEFAIGVDFLLVGTPKGASVPLKIIWRYPEPGLKSPDTGTTKLTDEYTDPNHTLGKRDALFWKFTEAEWIRVPGIWTLEVWQDDRKLLVQEFNLKKP